MKKKAKRPTKTASTGKPGASAQRTRFWPFGLLLFAALLFIDQYTKYLVLKNLALYESIKVMPGLWFTYVQNTGAAWGILQDTNTALMWLSVIAFGLLVFFYDKFETIWEKISYTLLLAGLWGNLIDRGVQGFVIDFIDLGWWPIFNIADSCIVIGVIIFLIEHLRNERFRKKPVMG